MLDLSESVARAAVSGGLQQHNLYLRGGDPDDAGDTSPNGSVNTIRSPCSSLVDTPRSRGAQVIGTCDYVVEDPTSLDGTDDTLASNALIAQDCAALIISGALCNSRSLRPGSDSESDSSGVETVVEIDVSDDDSPNRKRESLDDDPALRIDAPREDVVDVGRSRLWTSARENLVDVDCDLNFCAEEESETAPQNPALSVRDENRLVEPNIEEIAEGEIPIELECGTPAATALSRLHQADPIMAASGCAEDDEEASLDTEAVAPDAQAAQASLDTDAVAPDAETESPVVSDGTTGEPVSASGEAADADGEEPRARIAKAEFVSQQLDYDITSLQPAIIADEDEDDDLSPVSSVKSTTNSEKPPTPVAAEVSGTPDSSLDLSFQSCVSHSEEALSQVESEQINRTSIVLDSRDEDDHSIFVTPLDLNNSVVADHLEVETIEDLEVSTGSQDDDTNKVARIGPDPVIMASPEFVVEDEADQATVSSSLPIDAENSGSRSDTTQDASCKQDTRRRRTIAVREIATNIDPGPGVLSSSSSSRRFSVPTDRIQPSDSSSSKREQKQNHKSQRRSTDTLPTKNTSASTGSSTARSVQSRSRRSIMREQDLSKHPEPNRDPASTSEDTKSRIRNPTLSARSLKPGRAVREQKTSSSCCNTSMLASSTRWAKVRNATLVSSRVREFDFLAYKKARGGANTSTAATGDGAIATGGGASTCSVLPSLGAVQRCSIAASSTGTVLDSTKNDNYSTKVKQELVVVHDEQKVSSSGSSDAEPPNDTSAQEQERLVRAAATSEVNDQACEAPTVGYAHNENEVKNEAGRGIVPTPGTAHFDFTQHRHRKWKK
ncbi:unnamed protein product [Amoebophrya sp. A25]|nr:unnamed protein product [Amoebophrya sp. A25]|eukprot:GSA25T00026816001.1